MNLSLNSSILILPSQINATAAAFDGCIYNVRVNKHELSLWNYTSATSVPVFCNSSQTYVNHILLFLVSLIVFHYYFEVLVAFDSIEQNSSFSGSFHHLQQYKVWALLEMVLFNLGWAILAFRTILVLNSTFDLFTRMERYLLLKVVEM